MTPAATRAGMPAARASAASSTACSLQSPRRRARTSRALGTPIDGGESVVAAGERLLARRAHENEPERAFLPQHAAVPREPDPGAEPLVLLREDDRVPRTVRRRELLAALDDDRERLGPERERIQ